MVLWNIPYGHLILHNHTGNHYICHWLSGHEFCLILGGIWSNIIHLSNRYLCGSVLFTIHADSVIVCTICRYHIRKHIIVRLDAVSGLLYLIFSYYLLHHTFSYSVYMIFSLVIGSIGAVYNLAYTSLYPELITKGFMQKGYSISSIIYPSITAIMAPVASFMYVKYGIISICLLEGVLLLCASFGEHFIRYEEQTYQNLILFICCLWQRNQRRFRLCKKRKGIKKQFILIWR